MTLATMLTGFWARSDSTAHATSNFAEMRRGNRGHLT